jgi:hypothetical protein
VRAAFNEWDQELTRVGITFAEIEPGDSPDIRVLWTSRDVGGLGLTTGYFSGLSVHKKIELADDLAACCDGDDDWSAAQAPEFSIDHYYVKFIVLHELGHALGLDHLTRAEQQLPGANLAVMQPKGGQNNLPLSYIDIAKVKRRYGIPDLPSGRLLLYHMDSYHFAAGRMYSLSMGDFYFIFWPIDMVTSQPTPDAEPSFWANNGTTKGTLQAGLVDLGDIGDAPLTSVILPNYQSCGIMYPNYPNPESPCYFPYGVPAVIGHTYVSPAQESGHFIVFRVLSVAHNEYVEIAYQQR